MKADALLIEHHNLLRALFKRIDSTARGKPERRRLTDDLITECEMHSKIEEHIFYPAVRIVSPLVDVALAEHRQLADQIALVLRTRSESDRFDEEFHALTLAVDEHAGEEERDMFPQCHALGDARLKGLGTQMEALLEALRRSPHAQKRMKFKREILRRL